MESNYSRKSELERTLNFALPEHLNGAFGIGDCRIRPFQNRHHRLNGMNEATWLITIKIKSLYSFALIRGSPKFVQEKFAFKERKSTFKS